MPESNRIALVVLAAGGSSRMGRPKQNLEIRGKTLLQTTIDAAKEARQLSVGAGIDLDLFVVLGANELAVRAKNQFAGCEVLLNENWTEGMSSSIRCALKLFEVKNSSIYDAALFTVADLANIQADHFFRLLDSFAKTDKVVVCTSFKDKNDVRVFGVPALFKRELFEELMLLSGDTGARKVISKNADRLVAIPIDDGGFDVDTEFDYEAILAQG